MADDMDGAFTDGLLAGLSATLGHSIALDERGQCVLLFEDDVEIVLAVAADVVTLRSTLLPLTRERAAAALALNYGCLPPGLSVALDSGSGLLVLFGSCDGARMTPSDFTALVAHFVAHAPELRRRLSEQPEADLPAAAPARGAIRV